MEVESEGHACNKINLLPAGAKAAPEPSYGSCGAGMQSRHVQGGVGGGFAGGGTVPDTPLALSSSHTVAIPTATPQPTSLTRDNII